MPHPGDIRAFRRHADWALVAATAQELGIIDALAQGPATAEALAARLSLSPRGVTILLGALEGLSVVRRDPEGFRLTGAARGRLVDSDTPDYEAASLRHWLHGVRRWAAELPEALRRGAPVGDDGPSRGAPREPEALERFMAAMENKDPELVARVVDRCLARVPGAERMLDVGGGPGTFARAFAARGIRATLLDRPEVIDFVGPRYGLSSHPSVELVAGDFLTELPEGEFDIILVANITHIYPAPVNAELFRQLAGRLGKSGALAVVDFVRELSEFAPLFAITMLLNTEAGDTYRLAEYEAWLEAAGLHEVRWSPVGADVQLITATLQASTSVEAG
ncbi:MAG: methyltransferase [Gemmatimonadota bacterium]